MMLYMNIHKQNLEHQSGYTQLQRPIFLVCLVKVFVHCRKRSKKVKTEELYSKRKTIILIVFLDTCLFTRIREMREKKKPAPSSGS